MCLISYFTHTHTHTAALVHHSWGVAGERQAAGTLWVAKVRLVDQALEVGGHRGADGVVPQHVDHVVQSVQSVLHLRLRVTPGQRSGGAFGKKAELYVFSRPV